MFKPITKIISGLLGDICYNILSQKQFGFILGRNISYIIVDASEFFNAIELPSRGGNVALKIDIYKVFDTMHWDFILKLIPSFGFYDIFMVYLRSFCFCNNLNLD